MQDDDPHHWGDQRFDEFVEEELDGLAQRATAAGICIGCLSDRLLYEMIVSLMRSGASEDDITGLVQDALDQSNEADDIEMRSDPPLRIH